MEILRPRQRNALASSGVTKAVGRNISIMTSQTVINWLKTFLFYNTFILLKFREFMTFISMPVNPI